MEELKYQKLNELKTEGIMVRQYGFKPKGAPYVCLVIGIALMFVPNLLGRLLGAFFLLMSIVVFALVQDYKVIDIYDKGFVVFSDRSATMGCFIKYEDVKEWDFSHEQGHDELIFTLNDGNKIGRNSFQINGAYKVLDQYIHEKSAAYIRSKKAQETVFDMDTAINNFKSRFKRK